MSEENNKSTGVTFPYEKQAMNGDEMPEGLPYYDQLMYQLLRLLYDAFKKGIIEDNVKRNYIHWCIFS